MAGKDLATGKEGPKFASTDPVPAPTPPGDAIFPGYLDGTLDGSQWDLETPSTTFECVDAESGVQIPKIPENGMCAEGKGYPLPGYGWDGRPIPDFHLPELPGAPEPRKPHPESKYGVPGGAGGAADEAVGVEDTRCAASNPAAKTDPHCQLADMMKPKVIDVGTGAIVGSVDAGDIANGKGKDLRVCLDILEVSSRK